MISIGKMSLLQKSSSPYFCKISQQTIIFITVVLFLRCEFINITKTLIKKKDCGCIVRSILCGIKNTLYSKIYLIGGHTHFTICDKCKQDEENDDDTLHDMWINDNVTDEFGYAGWKEQRIINN